MKIDQVGLDFIKNYEKLRLQAYKDSGGIWTVGFGHILGVKEGDIIDSNVAQDYLLKDLKTAEDCVNSLVISKLTQNQYNACVSFAFNCGQGNFKKSTLLNCINKKNFNDAAKEFTKWNHVNGVIVNGLTNRRNDEKKLFET